VGGQAEGVAAYLEALRGQLVQAMVLTGCRSVQEAGRHILRGI
jgi:isopentenyl diphosphate isomerase/L-lactate dehydrogenase-like FMN-dependent dehydrogenase